MTASLWDQEYIRMLSTSYSLFSLKNSKQKHEKYFSKSVRDDGEFFHQYRRINEFCDDMGFTRFHRSEVATVQ